MSHVKTIHVPHLGGIEAGYQMPHAYDASKPTVVMVNSFLTTSDLYKTEFENTNLTKVTNLIAIEPLGHGRTKTKSINFTYWDTAIMNLQVLEALGVNGNIFVVGTSQGGWITARMALLAPGKIAGIVPLGTSMDYESERTRQLGCWDARAACTGSIEAWTSKTATPDFTPGEGFADFLVDQGFGKDCPATQREFWANEILKNFSGDEGRQRARMAAINLRDRDGLHGRLPDIVCPVLWLHGSSDVVYSVANAEEEIKLFVSSPDARVQVVEGGHHFLSATHPEVVDKAIVEFVGKYGSKGSQSRM